MGRMVAPPRDRGKAAFGAKRIRTPRPPRPPIPPRRPGSGERGADDSKGRRLGDADLGPRQGEIAIAAESLVVLVVLVFPNLGRRTRPALEDSAACPTAARPRPAPRRPWRSRGGRWRSGGPVHRRPRPGWRRR